MTDMKTRFDGNTLHRMDYAESTTYGPTLMVTVTANGDVPSSIMFASTRMSEAACRANGRLVAAAPDLLRVACELAEAFDFHTRAGCTPVNPCCGMVCRMKGVLADFHALVDPPKDTALAGKP